MENNKLENPLMAFDDLQEKLEIMASLSCVMVLAGSCDWAALDDFDGVLHLMNNISHEACDELDKVKKMLA